MGARTSTDGPRRRLAAAATATATAALLAVGVVGAPSAGATTPLASGPGERPVVFVGNNWDGTADVLAPRRFRSIAQIDVVPDRDERMAAIASDPLRLAYYLAVQQGIGEGHDQLVDDLYSSNDGRLLVVSRPSYADVVGISLRTGEIVWRTPVAGYRSDHMAMSPDGRRVVVSASTAGVVHVLRVRDGKKVGRFDSGDTPHESVYLDDGARILHASIGTVYTPTDQPALDTSKGERVLEIVDARTDEVLRRYDLRAELDRVGLEHVSQAVRPLTVSPDEKTFYFQVSFFHGFLEMERRSGRITRIKRLPNLVKDVPREQYVLDSAHHGIAMNPRGSKLCVAGTMSDYATVVDARTFERSSLITAGTKPYWVTPSADGRYCYVSWSGSDEISRISYHTEREVGTIDVGDHPQRVRTGVVRRAFVPGLRSGEGTPSRR